MTLFFIGDWTSGGDACFSKVPWVLSWPFLMNRMTFTVCSFAGNGCNIGSSILANSFPISSLNSFKILVWAPPGHTDEATCISSVWLFDELGFCPLLNFIFYLFLENTGGMGISLTPFRVKISLILGDIPFQYGTPNFDSLPNTTKDFRFAKKWPKRGKNEITLCVLLLSPIQQKSAVEKYLRERSLFTEWFFFLPYKNVIIPIRVP